MSVARLFSRKLIAASDASGTTRKIVNAIGAANEITRAGIFHRAKMARNQIPS